MTPRPLLLGDALDAPAGGSEAGAAPVGVEGDRTLLGRAHSGDEAACREILARHGQRLLDVVHATHGELGVSEDIVQETFIRAIAKADRLREEASMFPWLVQIAIRVGLDYRRKVRKETLTDVFADLPSPKDAAPDNQLAAAEDSERVRRALSRLKDYPRELIVLRYFASFSIAEIAAVFGKSEPAIRKDLQRARERVKRLLGGFFDGEVA